MSRHCISYADGMVQAFGENIITLIELRCKLIFVNTFITFISVICYDAKRGEEMRMMILLEY